MTLSHADAASGQVPVPSFQAYITEFLNVSRCIPRAVKYRLESRAGRHASDVGKQLHARTWYQLRLDSLCLRYSLSATGVRLVRHVALYRRLALPRYSCLTSS